MSPTARGHVRDMTTTLITGGNKGLGRETARRLREAGHDVWIGARDQERGEQAAAEVGVRFVQLDVTDDASVAAAVGTVGSLDVLVNNAGVMSAGDPALPSVQQMRDVYEVNVFGALRVFEAFLPLLQASAHGVVVNVSSGLGSISGKVASERYPSPFAAYGSSKAALNMLTAQWAKAFPDLRVNAADPGFTRTDLNGNRGTQTVTEGTDAIVELAQVAVDGPTATYLSREGVVPW